MYLMKPRKLRKLRHLCTHQAGLRNPLLHLVIRNKLLLKVVGNIIYSAGNCVVTQGDAFLFSRSLFFNDCVSHVHCGKQDYFFCNSVGLFLFGHTVRNHVGGLLGFVV